MDTTRGGRLYRLLGLLASLALAPALAQTPFTPASPITATFNVPYSTAFSFVGAPAPTGTVWSWAPQSASILPPGLSLSSSGVLSGTPTRGGSYAVTITATPPAASPLTAAYTINVTTPALSITSTSPLPVAQPSVQYNFTFAATGGTGAYTWTAASTLPPGLSLSSAGILTGTPTGSGPYNFSVRVTDSAVPSQSVTANFSLTEAPPLTIQTSALPNGIATVAYTAAISVTGGTAPYFFTVSAQTPLPAGLSLDYTTGVVSGTVAIAGTYSFTVIVKDVLGLGARGAITVLMVPKLVITTASLPDGREGIPYNATVTASGGSSRSYVWSIGSLPPGLSASGPNITGTPATAGAYNVTVQVTEIEASPVQTATATFTVNIANRVAISSTSPLPNGAVGKTYSQQLNAIHGSTPYSWSIAGGALPAGLTLSSSGLISGTPTTAGTATFQARVLDSIQQPATADFSLTIVPLLNITSTGPLPVGNQNVAYAGFTFAATGGLAPLTWSLASGSLPAGMALSSQGALTGTPTASGTFTLNVQVADSNTAAPQTVATVFSLTVYPAVTITTASPLPGGVTGKNYTLGFQATGGNPPFTWTVSAGTPPAGWTLSSAGVLSGTTSAAGAYNFTVQAADGTGGIGTKIVTVTVAAPLSITTASLPDGVVNVVYSQTFAATGGAAPYTWAVTAGALPPGLTLNSDGTLTGTPSVPGAFNFTLQATDSSSAAPQSVTAPFVLRVAPALAIISSNLGGAQFGQPFAVSLAAAGGVPPYNWSLVNGGVPGLTLSSAGLFGGVPTLAGTFTVVVRLGDTTPATVIAALQVTVAPPNLTILTNSPLPAAVLNTPYAVTIAAAGAPPPYLFSVDSGPLPPGLLLADSGLLSGTPLQTGTYTFSVRATSGTGSLTATTVKAFTLTVAQTDLSVLTTTLNGGVSGQPFAQQLAAGGGTPPYTWSLASGALPGPVSLSPAGLISGTPPGTGSFPIVVRVTDAGGLTATRALVFTVVESALQITTGDLPPGTAGISYTFTIAAAGGQPGYTFTLANGTFLPPGLNLLPAGAITGTPAASGAYNFAITAQDAAGGSTTKAFSLTIAPPPLAITTLSPLPPASAGQAYSAGLAATGGAPPYNWSAAGLPDGIVLNASTGALSGTPSTAGPFTVTATVTDAGGTAAQRAFTLTVKAPLLSVATPSNLGSAPLGTAASFALTATGGVPPYTWLILSGNPAGLTLNSTGALSGTPGAAGTYTFTAQVTDSAGAKDTRQFTLVVVVGALSVTNTTLPPASAGAPYNAPVTATGGLPPYSFSASGLPAGLSIDSSTGAITGSPTAGGPFTVVINVADSTGQNVSRDVGLNVTVPPLPPASLTGPPSTIQALDQPPLKLNIDGTMPVPVDGEVRLVFTADRGASDPAVQFATGGSVVRFTIQTGTNFAQFSIPNMALQTGSVAGTIVLTATFRAAGIDITPNPAPSVTIRLVPAPPGIRSVTAVRTQDGITVTVTGLANTREVTQATFRFNPTPGSGNQATDLTLNVGTLFTAWFAGPQSSAYGSQFTFVQPFNVSGDSSGIVSVTVTLINTLGASPSVTATVQ